MAEAVHIDGSRGEGGGQVVRSALSLAMVTGRPLVIENIRAKRAKPGLMRQHLTAVQAAAEICGAKVEGAELRSGRLAFTPGELAPGEHHFSVGTAGSTTLVLQTVLPALLTASGPSRLVLEGGTHNPLAPPFEFLAEAFLPLVARMGPTVEATLVRHGFYPAGGGRLEVTVSPAPRLLPLTLLDCGEIRARRARALVANLPFHIAERELQVVRVRLGLGPADCRGETVDSLGPGNVVLVSYEADEVTEVFAAFGEKHRRAEAVAELACAEARAWLAADVPVGPHLADQLLVPMALAGGGAIRTMAPTPHTRTNAEVIGAFLEVPIAFEDEGEGAWIIRAGG